MHDHFDMRYTIAIDEEGLESVVTREGIKRGSISLEFWYEDEIMQIPEHYKITDLFLEGCKHKGVGRRCPELHIETFGLTLAAGAPTENQKTGAI